MRRANGAGTIIKLTGNRRRPYAIRNIIGWREDGSRIIKYVSYHKTYREAERALAEYNADPYLISKKTLKYIYKEWYALKEQEKGESTLKGYRVCFNHLEPLHDIKIREIDRPTLQKYYNSVDISQNTLKKTMQLLNMLFDYSVKLGIMPSASINLNKTVNIPIKKVIKQKSKTVISKEDIDLLWNHSSEDYAKIILVYIYTGLRFSELQELRPENLHENYIEVTHSKTEAGIRIVPIADKIRSLLPIIQVPPRTTFERKFKYYLPNHYIHETRHTFISMMAEAGVDDRIIKAIVGHKSNDITQVYTHIGLDVMLEAVNRL